MGPRSLTAALRETLDSFDEPGTPLTTAEMADRLDLGRRSTFDRLERLVDAGHLESKKVGARGRVWWRPVPPGIEASGRVLSRLIDNVPGMVFRCRNEPDWPMTFASEAAADITGYDPAAFESGEISWRDDVVHPDDRDRFREEVASQLAVGDTYCIDYRILTSDGETRWVRSWGSAAVDPGDGTELLEGVVTDVTDTERSERALARRERQLSRERDLVERIFETSPVGLGVLSRDGLERFNDRAAEIYGSPSHDIEDYSVGEPPVYDAAGEPVPPGERPNARVLETGDPMEGWECQIEGVDGRRRWLSVSAAPLSDEGDVERVVVATEDITRFKKQSRQLERRRDELEAELDEVFERIDDAFYALDDDFRFTFVNERAEELLQRPASELLGQSVWETFPEATETQAWESLHEALESQAPTSFEVYLPPLSFWVGANVYPSETGLSVYFRDVSERKEAEKELRKSEERFRTLVEHAPLSIQIFDAVGRTIAANPAWEALWDAPRDELEDYNVLEDEQLEAAGVLPAIREAFAGEVVTLPLTRYDPADIGKPGRERWIEGFAYPLVTDEDGPYEVVLVHHDVTERKERERELERFETIVETVRDGVYAVDEAYRFTMINEGYTEIVGYDREELLGSHISTVVDDDAVEVGEQRREELLAGTAESGSVEVDVETATGETITVESRYAMLPSDESFAGTVGVVRDVTERREREHELERYEAIVETVDDGIYVVDSDGRIAMVNEAYAEQTGYPRDQIVGMPADRLVDEDTIERAQAYERGLLEGERETARLEADVLTAEGGSFRGEATFSIIEDDDEEYERVGVVRDVTERVARERELEQHVERQDAVTRLGRQALETRDVGDLMANAAESVASTLDNDYCKVLDLDAESDELLLREGVGWHDGVVGSATVSASEDESQAAFTLRSHQPVVVEDLATESRFSGPDLLTDHDVRSGISTIIGPFDDPWGILGTHDRSSKEFSEQDVNFVQSVANILASAIDQYRRERELATRGERLAALDDLNRVVRGLTEAVVDQSTREEIEAVVCEGLASRDSYEFAWIGEVDGQTQTMTLRTEAGVEGYLADRTISVDPDDPESAGPIRRSVETHEMQVIEDIFNDEAYERWRQHGREWNYQSAAVIPIVHEGVYYGVLNVYADRPRAFSGGEYEVVGHLGEVVGHAIAAIEQKRALTSSEVVELEFQIAGVSDAFDLPTADGRMVVDRSVPVGDGAYLIYGTATGGMIADLDAFVEAFPHWESAQPLERSGAEGVTRFEARLVDPPILSKVTALGGYVDGAAIEGGDYYLRIHLAPSVDARRLLDVVRERYPMARLVTRQQIVRDADSRTRLTGVLTDQLTERQRAALEVAYFAGYFEWPRDADGEVVAGSLGVSAPTFHQHLRNALRKLLRAALDAETPA